MPIKLPKGFNKRRSSGNALESADPPAQTSFRVLERPGSIQPTSDGDPALKRPPVGRPNSSPSNHFIQRPHSYGDGSDTSNRASGNTHNSNSTGGGHSSKRLSYASTVPSSVESTDDLHFPERPQYTPIPHRTATEPAETHPQSRKTFSLKAAGRTFSFGPKASNNKESYYDPPPQSRDRATTGSSYASTATPPKLDLGHPDSGFGQSDLGSVFSKGTSATPESIPPVPPIAQVALYSSRSQYQPPTGNRSSPSPIARTGPISSEIPTRQTDSPHSWRSNASQDRLMSSPRQSRQSASSDNFASTFAGDSDSQLVLDALYGSNALYGSSALNQQSSQQPTQNIPDRSLPTVNAHPTAWGSQNSVRPGQYQAASPRSPLIPGPASSGNGFLNVELAPSAAQRSNSGEESMFDAPRARRPIQPTARASFAMKTSNKVMTPAEFEAYKNRKDQGMGGGDAKSEASSDSETYEDEDDTERTKQLARQRRRQEAQLSVYRQQMMKVTGEQPSDVPEAIRPQLPLTRSSASAPSLLGSLSFEGTKAGKESDEEDDEVPLGVLQAHGFPARNRPPTRMSSSMSSIPRPDSQISSYPAPHGATRNDSNAGGGGNGALPVFAKNLPQDPYVGASLVNPLRRESVGLNGNPISHPGQQQAPPGLPPGGLVGVIAGEERARAARRGSPNSRGTYDAAPNPQLEQQQQQMMMMAQQQQMQAMSMGQPMTPGEQSTIQMNQQMQQMMQMQMQWMQQMMQMQGLDPSQMPGMPGMPPQIPPSNLGQPNSFLAPPDGQMRPHSMASNLSVPGNQAKRMSTMSRGSRSQFGGSVYGGGMHSSSANSVYALQPPQGGYAPSLAPSERSNVGQPNRYRPVTSGSNQQQSQNSRTSTMSQQTVQGSAMKAKPSKSNLKSTSSDTLRNAVNAPTTIKAVNKPKHGGRVGADEENDDEGWADMAKKKEQRKSKWKLKKPTYGSGTMPGAQEGGMEGLYYEG